MKTIKDMLCELDMKLKGLNKNNDDQIAQITLDHLNKYFFQSDNTDFISPFHQYWEENHKNIIKVSINNSKAKAIAVVFEEIFKEPDKYNVMISPQINKKGLDKYKIANIRFFTAIQDFKINIYKKGRDPFQKYHDTPEWFTPAEITEYPDNIIEFLDYLNADSQGDKRKNWMKKAALFLLDECNGEAYNLFSIYKNDVELVRNTLINNEIGFSKKKSDMFIRDMIDWKIWDAENNIEKLNVASDSNTMKIALRTGLLRLEHPLLSSYLDIYGKQYQYIDEKTQEAWRAVWNVWGNIKNNHRPPAPVSMDYLIYKSLGKKFCLINKKNVNNVL